MSKLHFALAGLIVAAVGGAMYLLFSAPDYGDINADGLVLGKAAYQQGDYDNAVKWYRLGAKKGDKQAQYLYAMLYRDGIGVSRDDEQAMHWLELSATQGDIEAQYQLAQMLEYGRALSQSGAGSQSAGDAQSNLKAAVRWYQKAALAGSVAGQLRMAVMLAQGRGVAKDDSKALAWAIKAAASKSMQTTSYLQRLLNKITAKAAAGDASSQFVLARIYQQGKGLNADMKKAKQWLQQSAENGNPEGQFHLAELLMHDHDAGQIPMAAQWYLKAAEQGHMRAAAKLGVLYALGQGLPMDQLKSIQWLKKAARYGLASAQSNLGVLYAQAGQDDAAIDWLKKAATQAYPVAQNNLAVMYLLARGVPRDEHAALKWMRAAAASDDAKAQYNMALMALSGTAMMQHEDAALWLEKVQAKADSDVLMQASWLLGLLYDVGYGVISSDQDAEIWYQQAADLGDADAAYNLAVLYYRQLKFKKAFTLLLQAAKQGDVEAQNTVASMYQQGQGVAFDAQQMVYWYQQAAKQGYAVAQFNLANLYRKGAGMPQQDKQAVYWYAKSAKQGFAPAQNALAYMYALGRGVVLNRQQAEVWFAKAVMQKLRIAEDNLALLRQKKNAFTLASQAVDVQRRSGILNEKPFNLIARIQWYHVAQLGK